MDEAKNEGHHFVELEPMSAEEYGWYGFIFYQMRQYDEAMLHFTKARDLDPNYPFAHYFLGQCYIAQGKFPEAIAEQKICNNLFSSPWSHGRLAYAYACAGNTQQALAILDTLKKQSDTMYVASDVIASVYVALGDKEHAFEYLNKAVGERAGWMVWLKLDPIWDPIRKDPRFIVILKKMGLN